MAFKDLEESTVYTCPRRFWTASLFALWAFLFFSMSGQAQQASASVNGNISDASGAAIPDAQVKLTNVDTSVTRTTTSNHSGTYVFLNVTPGVYTVSVEKGGFANIEQSKVKLDVDQTANFDFHMKVGSAAGETVEVTADAAGVESSSAELGTVIGTKQINDLPLNGRNFTQLLTLTPGVAPVTLDQTGGGGGAFAGSQIGSFSFPAINGQRVRSNIFLLDGVNNENTFLSSNNYAPIPDAISEFKVQTHNDDSQFGGVVGGIVNVVSKSGTNSYHGSVWEFIRNEQFDANSFYNNSHGKIRNPLRQNQFGGAIGGPVSLPKLYNGKDRTFFFAAYEGYRFAGAPQLSQRSASPAMRMGDFSAICPFNYVNGVCTNPDPRPEAVKGITYQLFDPASSVPDPANPGAYLRSPFPNNIIPQSRLDPTALAYQSIFPQGTPDPSNAPYYIAFPSGSSKTKQDEGQVRIDQTLGKHDQVYGRWAQYYQVVDTAQTVVQRHVAPIYGHNWTVHETHTFGASAILDAYIARNYGNNEQVLTLPNEAALLTAIQKTGVSQQFLAIGDLTTPPAIGFANGFESVGFQQFQSTSLADVWEYGGNFTKILGRHIVKIGGSIETNGFYSPIRGSHETFANRQTGGLGVNVGFGGNDYASFLLGAPDNAGNRVVNETVHGGYSDNAYIHDQWKVTNNLTINLGLRYDLKLWPIYGSGTDLYTGEPNPVTGQYIITALPPTCSATQGAPCIPVGQFVNNGGSPTPYSGLPPHVVVTPNANHAIITNDYGDIAGRVGIAYRVNEKLALRAGYGRFYDTWGAAAQDAQNFNGNWPAASLELNGLNSSTVTDPITNPLHLGAGGGTVYPSVDPYHSGTWSVDPNYKTPYSDQYNFGLQQELPGEILLDMNYVGSVSRRLDITDVLNVAPTPGPDPVSREPFPYMGNPWFQQSIGNSSFNALEVSLNKRATRNLAFLVSYTFSKSIDDGCSGDIGAGCSIQNVYNRSGDRSVSSFDLPHVFSASFTGTSPFGKGKQLDNRWVNAIAGGWALNSIVTLHSGVPYDIGASSSIPGICNCANTERASVVGNIYATTGPKTATSTWFNTAAIAVPAQYTFGTLPRNSLRADRWRNTDLSLFRQFGLGLGESRYLEFRAEAFNAFNNVVFAIPNTNINDREGFGHVNQGQEANAPRQLQFALKLVF